MEKIVPFVGYLCGFGLAQIEVGFYYWSCAILMAVVMVHDTKRMLIDPIEDEPCRCLCLGLEQITITRP
jgi:hypothetical protein